MGSADFSRAAGPAAIGARLRRLSERIDRDAAQLYRETGERFEQRWYGVFHLLAQGEPLSVGELAERLGLSHASISQIRDGLAEAGLITGDADRRNARLRKLRLTDDGEAMAARLAPLWAALNAAAVELNAEALDALAAVERLEQAVERRSLYERVEGRLAPSKGQDSVVPAKT